MTHVEKKRGCPSAIQRLAFTGLDHHLDIGLASSRPYQQLRLRWLINLLDAWIETLWVICGRRDVRLRLLGKRLIAYDTVRNVNPTAALVDLGTTLAMSAPRTCAFADRRFKITLVALALVLRTMLWWLIVVSWPVYVAKFI